MRKIIKNIKAGLESFKVIIEKLNKITEDLGNEK